MSLNIRFLNNGEKEIILVQEFSNEPVNTFYEKREDMPEEIRHYCPEKSSYVTPDTAFVLGCGHILYSEYIDYMCIMEEYKNNRCIFESCRHWNEVDGEYKCTYEEEDNA